MKTTEKRIGLMGNLPITAGFMRNAERRAKEMRKAEKGKLPQVRQKRLNGF